MTKKIAKKVPKQATQDKLPLKYVVLILGVLLVCTIIGTSLPRSPTQTGHVTVTAQRWSVPLPTMTQIPSRTPIPIKTATPLKIQFPLPTPTLGFEVRTWVTWNGQVTWNKTLSIRPQPFASGSQGYVLPNSIWEFDAEQVIEWRNEQGDLLYQDIWWRLTAQKNGWLPEVLSGVRYLEPVK